MCNIPKNPHLNPNPSACDVSASYCKAESLSSNFSNASRKSLYFDESIGYNPQNTIGFNFLYPGNASLAGLFANVIVSPTRVSLTFLIDAQINPTSPAVSSSTIFSLGV